MARNDRRAIERSVKEMFANGGQLVLPILSLVTEARAQLEDVLGEVNREILESILLASAQEIAGAKTPERVYLLNDSTLMDKQKGQKIVLSTF